MGRRHHRTPPKNRSRQRRPRPVPQPWDMAHGHAIRQELAEAYRALSVEWMAYLEIVDAADVAEFPDRCELLRLLRGLLRHSMAAAETASTATPMWVPASALASIADVDGSATDRRGLPALGTSGLMLFEASTVRAQESLPSNGPGLPEVDVDGVLWFTAPTVRHGCDTRLVVAPLTTARGLQPLRGEGWKASTLTEISCIDIYHGVRHDVDPGMHPIVELLDRMGNALQGGLIRVVERDRDEVAEAVSVLDAA